MAYINQPPDIRQLFAALDDRLRKLETAVRFTAPGVNFSTSTPTNPRTGDIFYDSAANLLKYYNGSAFIQLADNNVSTTVTQSLTTLQSTNNNMVFTGTPCDFEFQRVGKNITVNAYVTFTNVSNFGTGQIYLNIPGGIPNRTHDLAASGFLTDGGNTYTIFGLLAATDNKMYLWHPTSNGGSDILDHNSPAVLDATSVINITGVALLA